MCFVPDGPLVGIASAWSTAPMQAFFPLAVLGDTPWPLAKKRRRQTKQTLFSQKSDFGKSEAHLGLV